MSIHFQSVRCPICWGNFKQEEIKKRSLIQDIVKNVLGSPLSFKYEAVLTCGHGYHPGCIIEWFKTSSLCPSCFQKADFQDKSMDLSTYSKIEYVKGILFSLQPLVVGVFCYQAFIFSTTNSI